MSDIRPVIHRVTLDVEDAQTIEMHQAGSVLSVAPTRDGGSGQVDLWFTTYPNEPSRKRWIYMAGTWMPRPPGVLVGTVVTPSGLVWHVFDGGPQA